jgi:23S rRNA (uridine2552-2'-O)-methyltransferase
VSKDKKKGSMLKGGRAAENSRLKDKKKFKKSSQAWLERQINDPYVRQAKKDGVRSRAYYKIQEIDEHFRIFQPGQKIADLGAAPGSWCEYVVKKLDGEVAIVGVDLLHVKPIEHCDFVEGDFTDDHILKQILDLLGDEKIDVVLSDMAPNSTGHTKTDHLRIMYMLELALDFAVNNLKPGGSFICKVLRGGTERELLDATKKHFAKVKHFKPVASRQESTETYLVATGFRQATH